MGMDRESTLRSRVEDKMSCTYIDGTTFKESEALIRVKDNSIIVEIKRDSNELCLGCLCPSWLLQTQNRYRQIKMSLSSIDGCIIGAEARTFQRMSYFHQNLAV
jgi:hypothetical protein